MTRLSPRHSNRLITNGLTERRSYAEAPLGQTFADGPMRALAEWIIRYGDELFEAQERTRSAYA
ncbi:hypothetical protein [Micromonospora pallida]|uniref:hypothetical protein n=1 Tax=Micromonospora pallida TaxID=145854 RepID=UPI001FE186B6|nr:hypothetical protein [Micromonospora pallida]